MTPVRAAFAASVLALCGCATDKTVPESVNGNLLVRARVERGVDAAVYVHHIATGCSREYRGVVRLRDGSATIDLPVGQAAYLVARFDSSSLLAGSRQTSYGTVLEPRAGFRYELDLRYREGLYDVSLSERDERTGGRRMLPRREPEPCKG